MPEKIFSITMGHELWLTSVPHHPWTSDPFSPEVWIDTLAVMQAQAVKGEEVTIHPSVSKVYKVYMQVPGIPELTGAPFEISDRAEAVRKAREWAGRSDEYEVYIAVRGKGAYLNPEGFSTHPKTWVGEKYKSKKRVGRPIQNRGYDY